MFGGHYPDWAELVERGAYRRLEEPAVMALNPLAREVVPDAEDERVVLESAARSREPLGVGAVSERFLETSGNFGPQSLCAQLNWPLHSPCCSLRQTPGSGDHSN